MEEDVWAHAETARAAGRFLAVLVPEGSDRDVHRQYQVATLPTALVADPWGNEIVRMINYVDRDRFVRILDAMPPSFGPAAVPARALAKDADDAGARFELGRFYEREGLREVAEKYYERASLGPRGREPRLRRDLAVARGLNLLRLKEAARAGDVFRGELAAGPAAPDDDVLLLGVTLALVQQGKRREAEAALAQMEQRFPESPYTAKAREALPR
jgi:tetratricopeptide (TPR) repeat protein